MTNLKQIGQIKPLESSRFKPMAGFAAVDESKLANVGLRLEAGLELSTRLHRSFEVLDKAYRTTKQLKRLPSQGEAIHCVLTGAYALFDFIPAAIELSGRQKIEQLQVCTLGFSKKNVSDLMKLVDAGLVGNVSVLCSHYFSAADSAIYKFMVEAFHAHGFKVVAMRTHAKILLMSQGANYYTIESSANLRSSHNVEQATVINDAELYHFHSRWISDLIQRGESKPQGART